MEKADSVRDELYAWAKKVHFCGYTDVVEQCLAGMDVYALPSIVKDSGVLLSKRSQWVLR